jgi:uncharacterized membrane protein
MVKPGTHLWRRHPAVGELTFGEKAADWLKHWFGTWIALGTVGAWIAVWILLQRTAAHWDAYPYILLNLCLSCLAAVQGIILQISANRGDRISGQVALHTESNTNTLTEQSALMLSLQQEQMKLLACLDHVNTELNIIRAAIAPTMENPVTGRDTGSSR